MKRSKGFTLIELLAVIVILAIIALIATPMVLKYIENAKEGSNDISVESILKAADDYYVASQLDGGIIEDEEFDLSNPSDAAKLGLKGNLPQGILRINSNGTTYLQAYYEDGSEYTKLENETKVTKNKMVIGSSALWKTKNGKIIDYISNDETIKQQIEFELNNYLNYVIAAANYATGDRSSTNSGFDYSKSLAENVEAQEKSGQLNRSGLPLELNKEIDIIITLFNSDTQLSKEQATNILMDNADKLPNTVDFFVKTEALNSMDKIFETTAYQLISNSIGGISNMIVIPNYVKHEDGTLEKVTVITKNVFYKITTSGGVSSHSCTLAPQGISETNIPAGKDLIISNGIKTIEEYAFFTCLLNSVILPNTLESIGASAFNLNQFNSVILPNSLTAIEKYAFTSSGIRGNLIIPNNVTKIGDAAFAGGNCDESSTEAICKLTNEITNVTFAPNSKIDTIGESAFEANSLTKIVIPGSITKIGSDAFNCSTLTSATIERAQGSDLTLGTNAFGSVTPTYKS